MGLSSIPFRESRTSKGHEGQKRVHRRKNSSIEDYSNRQIDRQGVERQGQHPTKTRRKKTTENPKPARERFQAGMCTSTKSSLSKNCRRGARLASAS